MCAVAASRPPLPSPPTPINSKPLLFLSTCEHTFSREAQRDGENALLQAFMRRCLVCMLEWTSSQCMPERLGQ